MTLSSIQLEAFLSITQTLNFTRAAEQLHITQSALSQRIMKLEEELETSLFIRDRAGLRLTEAAQELVRYCRCKNSLEEEFLSGLQGRGLSGVVRIGGFSSVIQSVILPSLASLFSENSKLKLHALVNEVNCLPSMLHRGEIDYMVLDREEQKEDLVRIFLGNEKNVLMQKKKYKGPDIYLDHDESDRMTIDYLKISGKKTKNIERRYLNNVYGLIEGVRYGFGRAVLPLHLIAKEKDFEIVNADKVLETPVFLYFYAQPYYSKLHSKVIAAITENSGAFLV